RPRSNVFGPIETRSDAVDSVAIRMTESAERNPLMAHTAVEIIFGLMPVSRARSGLPTEARTDSPNAVCPSNHHSPRVTMGTTISAMIWPGFSTMSDGRCHSVLNGVGYADDNEAVRYSGNVRGTACARCAT